MVATSARGPGKDGEHATLQGRDDSKGALVKGQDSTRAITLRQDDQRCVGQPQLEIPVAFDHPTRLAQFLATETFHDVGAGISNWGWPTHRWSSWRSVMARVE